VDPGRRRAPAAPYVEQSDEYHLHALTALYRQERGDAGSLEESVRHLARLWQEEDEELRRFREETVCKQAADLRARGEWPGVYLDAFADAPSTLPDPTQTESSSGPCGTT
jgi:hypothetical protein